MKIAIIGGGASGLATARILQRANEKMSRDRPSSSSSLLDITLLEKDRHLGGVWNYAAGNPTKPMYRGLRTNLPKEIMAFREFPWPQSNDDQASFLPHQQVQAYLMEYCNRFALDQFIRKGCQVKQLTCLQGTRSSFAPDGDNIWPKICLEWEKIVTTETSQAKSSKKEEDIFDAVFICNGHYSRPRIPHIPGWEHYSGHSMHSISYDSPEQFAGQTVLCVGGRASGSDIAREIAGQPGTTVYLSDSTRTTGPPLREHNVTWISRTTRVRPDGRVEFATTANSGAPSELFDTIIWCTGYNYDFPFLNAASGVELEAKDRRCSPLYEQLWHAEHPNIAFIGLPHSVLPFPLFELQAEAVINSWLRRSNSESTSSLDLPPKTQRLQHAAEAALSGGKTNGRVPDDTHYLGSAQWEYCRQMARYAGILDDTLDAYLNTNQVGLLRFALWLTCSSVMCL